MIALAAATCRREADAVVEVEGIGIAVAKAVVGLVAIGCAVHKLHRTRIIVLVETLLTVPDGQTAVELGIMDGALASEFDTIGIAAIGKIREIFAAETAEVSVDARHTRVICQIVSGRTIVISDAVDVDSGRAVSLTLVGVPAVIGIVPGATADIDIAWAGGALFIGESIGIPALILIVEVIVGITKPRFHIAGIFFTS